MSHSIIDDIHIALCEKPRLTRRLDPPARYSGRRPHLLPFDMPEDLQSYISRHDGHWLQWKRDDDLRSWECFGCTIVDDGKYVIFASDKIEPIEKIEINQANMPEIQALFGILARNHVNGPGIPLTSLSTNSIQP